MFVIDEHLSHLTLYIQSIIPVYVSFADTTYVRIFVSDVNDNAPAFPYSVHEISIDEDKDVGYIVLTATASDADEGVVNIPLIFSVLTIILY